MRNPLLDYVNMMRQKLGNTVSNSGSIAGGLGQFIAPMIGNYIAPPPPPPIAPMQTRQDLSNPDTMQLAQYNDYRNKPFDTTLAPMAAPTPSQAPSPLSPLAQGVPNVLSSHTFTNPLARHEAQAQVSPTPTPFPISASNNYTPNITIPTKDGQITLPPELTQNLLNNFNATGEATHAAQVLIHPADDPYVPGMDALNLKPQLDDNKYGENGSFGVNNNDAPNGNGTIDRGLFRINSKTFSDWMNNPVSKAMLAQHGITSYEDMNDPQKNALFASKLQQEGGWRRWFAAPHDLRSGDYSSPNALTTFHPKGSGNR